MTHERLVRLMKPTNRTRRRFGPGIGDGDVCPVEPRHGAMLVLRPLAGRPSNQYCPHHSHDGNSRAFWPVTTVEKDSAS